MIYIVFICLRIDKSDNYVFIYLQIIKSEVYCGNILIKGYYVI